VSNWLLYSVVIATWGTSWLAIKYQLGDVHPQMSVAYRFLLSGVILLAFCLLAKKNLRFTKKQHLRIFLQAIFIFSTNYIFIYRSSAYLASGLESIIFSTMTFMNIFNSRLFLKQKVSKEVIIATIMGFVGIIIVFNKELKTFDTSSGVILGIVLGLIASYSASLGNIISSSNQKCGLPVIESTAIGMLYGGIWTFILSLCMGIPATFSTKSEYIISLLFLSVFASVLAFVSYLTLLGRIGPSRVGYCVLVFPIIAVTLSVFFEDYHLGWADLFGMALVLTGNYIVMFKPQLQKST
jgi:drug/metabolite transporter (DMT)-like permease